MKTSHPAITLLVAFLSLHSLGQIVPTQPEEPATPTTLPTTTIEFDESEYDFGLIYEGDKVSHVFRFTNTGTEPLIITKATGSCGCTVPHYPKVPILPGETSEIEVEFNSKAKKGLQSKRVTITANTEPAKTFLAIGGEVMEVDDDTEFMEIDETLMERRDLEAADPNCFAIFPNPTNEILQLELREYIGQSATIDIHNKSGKKIMDAKIESITRETTRFDVSSFAPGIYLISIRVDQSPPMTQCFVVTAH
jgi:hypothetical protein